MLSARLEALADALVTLRECEPLVRVELPLAVASVANLRQHWAAKAAKAKTHRVAARIALAGALARLRGSTHVGVAPSLHLRQAGLVVRLVRISPRPLDDDNAASSMKNLRDGVADALGVDDRDARVVWVVDQAKGKAAVLLEVYRMGGPYGG